MKFSPGSSPVHIVTYLTYRGFIKWLYHAGKVYQSYQDKFIIMNNFALGFNGIFLDPVSTTSHLGNGYRSYNPVLMRLHCPDSWSPFGGGGINAYTYCVGDPVNRSDVNGHHSVMGWLGISVGMVLGLLLTPVSGGSSLTATLSVVSVSSALISAGLAVAQQFVEKSAPAMANTLRWAALGMGVLSGLSSIAGGFYGGKSLFRLLTNSESILPGTLGRTRDEARICLNRTIGRSTSAGLVSDVQEINPDLNISFMRNSINMLERRFTTIFYRYDNMSPDEVLNNGFHPSTIFRSP